MLFRQQRVGADEKVFIYYMFRSMYEDAEARQAEFEAVNEADGAVFKMKDDPRITPVGRSIRRWSIDELSQLINVLKGEMSLVGQGTMTDTVDSGAPTLLINTSSPKY